MIPVPPSPFENRTATGARPSRPVRRAPRAAACRSIPSAAIEAGTAPHRGSVRALRAAVLTALLLLAALVPVRAQLSMSMQDVDFSALPRVSLRLCVEKGGSFVRGLDSSHFLLTENGVPQRLTVRCPDPNQINSVVEVLDNSGSIFPVLPKLLEAAGRMIDSLGATDEAAILAFGRSITLAQDFTTDKAALRAALGTLVANGGTALYDASYEAVSLLSARSGNRHAVIITDGADNLSVRTADDVINAARAYRVKLYTIAFNIAVPDQIIMQRMAVETGGSFFVVERPSELNSVYERIAAEITERCCIASYESTSCEDSVRVLDVTVADSGLVAAASGAFTSPSRPERAVLAVDVPDALTPFASGIAFVTMTPPPSPLLALTLSFTVAFDPDLLDVQPLLPFTLGTVTQNQVVTMQNIGAGRLRISLRNIRPALATGALVGFPIQALPGDSSRRVPFVLEDVVLEGCPTLFTLIPDSTSVCQCRAPLDAAFAEPVAVVHGDRVEIPVVIGSGLDTSVPMLARVDLELPPELRLRGVRPGTLLPPGTLAWSEPSPGRVRLDVPYSAAPTAAAGPMAVIEADLVRGSAARMVTLRFSHAELWQRCCPDTLTIPDGYVLQDGWCERVLDRSGEPSVTVAPNPVVQGRDVRVRYHLPGGAGALLPVSLTVHDAEGRLVRVLVDGMRAAGPHEQVLGAADLPSGAYHLLLTGPAGTATAALRIVR